MSARPQQDRCQKGYDRDDTTDQKACVDTVDQSLHLLRRAIGSGDGVRFAGLRIVALPAQQLVCRDTEDLCDHRQQRQIRIVFVALPAADGLVGDVEPFRKILLCHTVCLAQC